MPDVHPEKIDARLAALPGIERLRAAAADLPVYLVGGAVRDLLLGRDRADVDLVVEGAVDELAGRLGGAVRAHERFATATVRVDGLDLDLATARTETYPRPGALPEVSPADLRSDLARRDFTVNAMALPLSGEQELIDPHDGLRDLRAGLLRVLHSGSFTDDPTRALRAARYAARLGLEPSDETRELLAAADLEAVSRQRVEAELRRLAHEDEPARGFELLEEWGLLALPPQSLDLIAAIGRLGAPWTDFTDPTDAVVAAALRHTEGASELSAVVPASPSEAVDAAHGHSAAELLLARAMGADWLDRYIGEWRDVRLEISGNDLLAEGVERGPGIGRGLDAALQAKLDGRAAGRDDELRIAVEAARAT